MHGSVETDRQDEAALLRRSQAGDAAAYAALLHLVAARVSRPPLPWAEPEAQQRRTEAVLRLAHRLLHTADPNRPLGPWVDGLAAAVDRDAAAPSWPGMVSRMRRLVAGTPRRALGPVRRAAAAAAGLRAPPRGRA